MGRAWRAARLFVLPTVALGIVLAIAPDRGRLWAHVWLLVVLGIGVLAMLGIVRAAYPTRPSPFAASLRQPVVTFARPAALLRLEREVSMAGSAAFDVHSRLRPTLVELASELLAARRGIDLEGQPAQAHAVLGDDAWELVRPDRPEPTERLATGIEPEQLERVVSALERI